MNKFVIFLTFNLLFMCDQLYSGTLRFPIDVELLHAAKLGDFEKIKKCVEAGADIHVRDEEDGRTPLHIVINQVVPELYDPAKQRSNLNLLDNAILGQDLDAIGYLSQRSEIVQFLLQEGIKKSGKQIFEDVDFDGNNALILGLTGECSDEILQELILTGLSQGATYDYLVQYLDSKFKNNQRHEKKVEAAERIDRILKKINESSGVLSNAAIQDIQKPVFNILIRLNRVPLPLVSTMHDERDSLYNSAERLKFIDTEMSEREKLQKAYAVAATQFKNKTNCCVVQ